MNPQPQREAPKLKADETIINPFYMRQLLQHAIHLARENKLGDSEEELHQHAIVSLFSAFRFFHDINN